MKTNSIVLGLVALSAMLVAAAPAKSEDPVLLALSPIPGETWIAQSTMTNKMNISGAVAMDMNQAVTSTGSLQFAEGSEGWTKFTSKTTDMKVTSDADLGVSTDDMVAMTKQIVVTGMVKPDGSQKDYKVEGPAEVTGMMSTEASAVLGFLGLNLPKAAVPVGHTWTVDAKVPSGGSGGMVTVTGGSIKATYSLKGTEIKDGHTLATITISMVSDMAIEGPTGAGKIQGNTSGSAVIDLTEGIINSIELNGVTSSDMGVVQVKAEISSKTTITKAISRN